MDNKNRYTIVAINDREEFIKQILAQDVHFHIPERDTPFSRAVMQRWPGTIWCSPKWGESGWRPRVAKIPTKAGRVVAWRNGGDRANYNFIVYVEATKEFHPRPNVKDVNLIELIDSPKDAVLFVGRSLGKRNMAYLERILKKV